MSLSGDKAARKRLGRLLVQARVDLDVRYKNRAMFARERGLNYRLVQDIENAARDNFDEPTKLAIERAYNWAYGSIDTVMNGGDPVKAVYVPPRVLALIQEAWGSLEDAPEHIRTFAEAEQFPEEFRLRMISGYIDRTRPGTANPGRHLREA